MPIERGVGAGRMVRRAAVVRVNVCVRVRVSSAADRRGVTAGQVEAVFAVEQHLLLVTLEWGEEKTGMIT